MTLRQNELNILAMVTIVVIAIMILFPQTQSNHLENLPGEVLLVNPLVIPLRGHRCTSTSSQVSQLSPRLTTTSGSNDYERPCQSGMNGSPVSPI